MASSSAPASAVQLLLDSEHDGVLYYPHLLCEQGIPYRRGLMGYGRLQQPPPYQQTDTFLESGRSPVTSHIHSENEPLLGQSRPTPHDSPIQERRPAKNRRLPKLLWFIGVFLIGYLTDRCYNYDSYEKLRHWTQEEEYRENMRALWVEEVKQHEANVTKWKEEKAYMDAERKKWEEEHERQRPRLTWGNIHPGRCLRYATREYKAVLTSIGIGMDALGECSNKTLSFHGREVLPTFCNLEGPCGSVTGHWAIDFDEYGCSPWWDTLTDKGCDRGMHKRRYEAHLMEVQNKDDWEVLCKKTPTTINGVPHDGAMSCLDSFWGVIGIWFIEDKNCS